MLIHPQKDGISFQDLSTLNDSINALILPEFEAFTGHPFDEHCIKGEYTRREPYPNLQFNRKSLLDEATNILKKTKYYDDLEN
jgi:hypothetical protein